jgi:apolipoprotein N-acyltransferase
MTMKKQVYIPNTYLFIPPVACVGALVCLQEGRGGMAAGLAAVAAILGVVGALRTRLSWVPDARDQAKAHRISEAIKRDGYWISEE